MLREGKLHLLALRATSSIEANTDTMWFEKCAGVSVQFLK